MPCHRLHHLTLETLQALQMGLQAIHDQPMGWNLRLPARFRKRIGQQCIFQPGENKADVQVWPDLNLDEAKKTTRQKAQF